MKKILLIDDDQFIRDVVGAKLSETYELSIAATGEEGYISINESTPDLVLLDLDLPDMSGMTILADLKKEEKTKNIPVIIFSNNDSPNVQAQARQTGADDFFVKVSVNIDELKVHIEKILTA